MARARYWKLEPSEVMEMTYDESKILNWDIKCVREPESDAVFVGVFLYRNGTPLDYEMIRGIAYYHNHVPKKEVDSITKFLKSRYGGESFEKGERVFLKGSSEIYSGVEIARLATDISEHFGGRPVITLEFADFDEEEMAAAGLPASKLLPIPVK